MATDINTTFGQLLLTDVQRQAKRWFPNTDMRTAATAFKQAQYRYCVEIVVEGNQRHNWYGRAYDANEAKYKAWCEFLTKQGLALSES